MSNFLRKNIPNRDAPYFLVLSCVGVVGEAFVHEADILFVLFRRGNVEGLFTLIPLPRETDLTKVVADLSRGACSEVLGRYVYRHTTQRPAWG